MANFQVGDHVFVYWPADRYWYPAVIEQIKNNQAFVKWLGYMQMNWADFKDIAPVDIRIGDNVECRWKKDKYYYKGEVNQISGGKYLVVYNDGESEWSGYDMFRILNIRQQKKGDNFHH